MRGCRSIIPRFRTPPETILLALAFGWTVAMKLFVLHRSGALGMFNACSTAVEDLAFFACVCFLFSLIRLAGPGVWASRLLILLSAMILGWSCLDAAWLLTAGVQLHPSILGLLAHEPTGFFPVVYDHLVHRPFFTTLLAVTASGGIAWIIYRIIRPACTRQLDLRTQHRRWTWATLPLLMITTIVWASCRTNLNEPGRYLGHNSHWQALLSYTSCGNRRADTRPSNRSLPLENERVLSPPHTATDAMPNVVLLMLESMSYSASSLDSENTDAAPALARLANEGMRFTRTYAPIPHTSKSFWAVLTGSMPDTSSDAAECVPADRTYESLATMLRRNGYRSAFFQMAKGSFECTPGLFANMGFDHAWFRENLRDPSAHLGYLGGDDARMLEPAFSWASSKPGPFFLMMITSAAHDPYDLPAWYASPGNTPQEKYAQAIRFNDYILQRVCDALHERALENNTLLCVLGDHGESFRPYGSRRWMPYEEVIRVPWVIRWPGHIRPGQHVDALCSQLDVTPTILSMLGYGITEAAFEGGDARTPSPPDRKLFFSSWYADGPRGYIEDRHKRVYWPRSGEVFSYDLANDPGEQSPQTIDNTSKNKIIEILRHHENTCSIDIPQHRFVQRLVFEHWRVFASGRSAWAYYVP